MKNKKEGEGRKDKKYKKQKKQKSSKIGDAIKRPQDTKTKRVIL